jgi:hypothetical protein
MSWMILLNSISELGDAYEQMIKSKIKIHLHMKILVKISI